MVYIYGLLCPLSGEIRYIGKSIDPERRVKGHISGAKSGAYSHHTSRWIRKLDRKGLAPQLVVLQEVGEDEDWRQVEREWISSAIASGWPLTNSTAGGEGPDYIRPEDRERYRENHRAAMERYRASPQGAAQLERMLLAARSPEVVAKRSESIRKACRAPEYRERMRAVGSEVAARAEVKAAKSSKSRAMWEDPEKRARFMASFSSDECKKKQSEAKRSAWADPVIGAKFREIHSSDEARRKRSEAAKRRATPEYRAMMAERTRLSWEKRRARQGA
jgi:predicted GIY-YIG superfamily endonuclease